MSEKTPSRSRMLKVVIGIWVGVLIVGILLFVLNLTGMLSFSDLTQSQTALDPAAAPKVGQPAPKFALENLAGQTIRLSDLRGRAVILNFWATWCGPCIREMPMFNEYSQKYSSNLVVIGVDMQEDLPVVQEFLEDLNFDYEMIADQGGEIGKAYQVFMLPTTFFIDAEGILRAQHIGSLSEEQFNVYLAEVGVAK
ncbi:MAG: TlpA family protein disulfide reductase [Anaerolineales bacterium]|nr:TlpA family protein disulfide reductase [Anaerolineales bacterium]